MRADSGWKKPWSAVAGGKRALSTNVWQSESIWSFILTDGTELPQMGQDTILLDTLEHATGGLCRSSTYAHIRRRWTVSARRPSPPRNLPCRSLHARLEQARWTQDAQYWRRRLLGMPCSRSYSFACACCLPCCLPPGGPAPFCCGQLHITESSASMRFAHSSHTRQRIACLTAYSELRPMRPVMACCTARRPLIAAPRGLLAAAVGARRAVSGISASSSSSVFRPDSSSSPRVGFSTMSARVDLFKPASRVAGQRQDVWYYY